MHLSISPAVSFVFQNALQFPNSATLFPHIHIFTAASDHFPVFIAANDHVPLFPAPTNVLHTCDILVWSHVTM